MKTLVTVSNALLTAMLDGISVSDATRQQLVDDSGLVYAQIRDIHGRTSIVAVHRLWTEILATTHDEFIGLEIGTAIPAERFGLTAHAASNSRDFREALDRFCKYVRLINDLMRCSVEVSDENARFTARMAWDVLGLERHAVDICFAAVVTWARRKLGSRFALREVRVKHSRVMGRERYSGVFEAPIMFGCPRNELVFDPAALGAVIAGGNPELGSILDRYASNEASRIPIVGDLPSRVLQLLVAELEQHGTPTLPRLCEELKLPARQLQRKLHEAGTSFSDLLEEVRKSLAPMFLDAPDTNVEQVGFRLGYSEPTAFIRAFKKWYGLTPGEYRRANSAR